MNLTERDLHELADLAITAATRAGQMIARSRPTNVQHKADGVSLASQVVTEIDREAENIILKHLSATLARFELGLLTEERDDDGGRHTADYFWCIDPLDGTLPFIEGLAGYSVSIALVGRDGTPWVGVVYDPVHRTLLHAIRGVGAFRDGKPWTSPTSPRGVNWPMEEELSVMIDRSVETSATFDRLVAAFEHVAHGLGLRGLDVYAAGGGVMNACEVLARAPACYVKFPKPTGGGSLWDFAATACFFHEVGAVATDIYGAPLDLNRRDSTRMNHRGVLFATNETMAAAIRAIGPGAT